jgi:hypothetical protein
MWVASTTSRSRTSLWSLSSAAPSFWWPRSSSPRSWRSSPSRAWPRSAGTEAPASAARALASLARHVATLGVALLLHVEAVDEAGELGQRGERQHHVLVHLEGVGAAGDGAQLLAVGPELLGLGGVAGLEEQRVGVRLQDGADGGHAAGRLGGRVAHHVDEQHRLGGLGPRRLDLVLDGPDVLVVEVLQGHEGLLPLVGEGEGARQLQDDLGGLLHVRPEELQAQGPLRLVLGVEDELGRGDDPVGPLLLQAGHSTQGLVGDVLPEPLLADLAAREGDALHRRPVRVLHLEGDGVLRQDLAELVVDAAHRPGAPRGHGDAPGQQVVDAGAPQDAVLAAGVLGDVAADGAGPGAGGVGGEDQPPLGGVLHGPLGDDAGLQLHDLRPPGAAAVERQLALGEAAHAVELLGVDHHAVGAQRHRPAGQPGAGAARDGLEPQPGDGGQERRDLRLLVRHDHGGGQVEPPVGGVGGVGDQREGVEEDGLGPHHGAQLADQAAALLGQPLHLLLEAGQQAAALDQDLEDARLPAGVALHHPQVLAGVLQQPLEPPRRVDQLLQQERVAAVDQQLTEEA